MMVKISYYYKIKTAKNSIFGSVGNNNMIDSFFQNNFLDRYPDYPLHPCNFNLRPDKISTFKLGLGASPEGWWDCTMYLHKGKDYKDWAEICWVIENTEKSKIYFWLKILSCIGDMGSKHVRPYPLITDAFHLQIVDHSTPGNNGYGPEHKIEIVFSVDDVFKFMRDHHLLSKFFFSDQEKKNLKLDFYVDR